MKQVKVFFEQDKDLISLMFSWNEEENCWICKVDSEFMNDIGPLPVES